MDIKERIALQMRKAGVKPQAASPVPAQPAPGSVPELIAKQIHRAKVDAAIAAMKKPPPDYVYREPRMPVQKPTEAETVQRFLDDRIYDDIPMEKSKLDPSRIKSMGDVHRVIVSEQPREFVVGPESQVQPGGAGFGDIGMENLEGPGYSAIRTAGSDSVERVVQTPEENYVPQMDGIRIDLSGSFGNARELPAEPPPMEEPATKAGNPMEMNGAQRQMLAAMRAQRNAKF